MKGFFFAVALLASAPAFAQDATDEGMTPPHQVANLCDLNVVAFSNRNFNTQNNAQANCTALEAQTNTQNTCKVVRNGARFQAQFRLNQAFKQQVLAQLLTDLQNFLLNNNIFTNTVANTPLRIQAQTVGDNCQ